MERIRKLIVKHLWWLVLLAALGMLVCHGLGVKRVVVDNTSLILLAIVLISPFVAAIKKVKIGEFEAEIQPEEVSRVTREVEKAIPVPDSAISVAENETAEIIVEFLRTDPLIALAKLRIELETRLRRLQERITAPEEEKQGRPSPTHVIRKLVSSGILRSDFGNALRDVISICNRAIHGEDIREVDAYSIVNTGIELLKVLDAVAREHASPQPIETAVITPRERDTLAETTYLLTTVVPLVEKPKRHVYRLTQEELADFLEDYSEYAEFLVALKQAE